MTDERRPIDSMIASICSGIATFALFDPALRWFIGAVKHSPELRVCPPLVAFVLAIVVAVIAGRAARARSRGRATVWMLLVFPGTLAAIVASWVLTSRQDHVHEGLGVGSLVVAALEVFAMPPIVFVASLPVVLASVGATSSRAVKLYGAATTLLLAGAFDLAMLFNPLSLQRRNPSLSALPMVVWLDAFLAVLTAVVLVLAARQAIVPKRLRVGSWVLALALLAFAPVVLVAVFRGAWTRLPTNTHESLRGAARAPDGSVWIVGEGGGIFRMASGKSEVELVAESPIRLYAVCAAKGGVWIVGDRGLVKRGDRGTGRWTVERPASTEPRLNAVWCDDDAATIAVGEAGTILRRRDDGSWETRPSPVSATFTSVTGSGRDRFVLAFDGPLLRSDDAGERFEKIAPAVYGSHSITVDDGGVLWWVGSVVRRSTDRGASFDSGNTYFEWRSMLSVYSGGNDEYDAAAHGGGATFVAGNRVMRTDDGGRTLTAEKVYVQTPLHGLAVDGAGRVIAVGDDGLVLVRPSP